ncbi:MAG: hypothetical protein ABI583_09290, partial [Betaproteobacteria bacterium]
MSKKLKQAEAVIPEDILAAMLMAMPVLPPSSRRQAAMKKSLLTRVDKIVKPGQAAVVKSAVLVVRAEEGSWFNYAPNVDMKVLHDDGDTRTWLARFGPGGRISAHMQTGDEEAIIMQGWCYLDD